MNQQKPNASTLKPPNFQAYNAWTRQTRFACIANQGAVCSMITIENQSPTTLRHGKHNKITMTFHPLWQLPMIKADTLVTACHNYLGGMVDLLEDLFEEPALGKGSMYTFSCWQGLEQKPKSLELGDACPAISDPQEWHAWLDAKDTVAMGQKLAIPVIYSSEKTRERDSFVRTVLLPTLHRAGWRFLEQRVWR